MNDSFFNTEKTNDDHLTNFVDDFKENYVFASDTINNLLLLNNNESQKKSDIQDNKLQEKPSTNLEKNIYLENLQKNQNDNECKNLNEKESNLLDKKKIQINRLTDNENEEYFELLREKEKNEKFQKQYEQIKNKKGEIPEGYTFNSEKLCFEKIPIISEIENQMKEINYEYLDPKNKFAKNLNEKLAEKIKNNPDKIKEIFNKEMINKVTPQDNLNNHYNKKLMNQLFTQDKNENITKNYTTDQNDKSNSVINQKNDNFRDRSKSMCPISTTSNVGKNSGNYNINNQYKSKFNTNKVMISNTVPDYKVRLTNGSRDLEDFVESFGDIFKQIFVDDKNREEFICLKDSLEKFELKRVNNLFSTLSEINQKIKHVKNEIKDDLIIYYIFLYQNIFHQLKKNANKINRIIENVNTFKIEDKNEINYKYNPRNQNDILINEKKNQEYFIEKDNVYLTNSPNYFNNINNNSYIDSKPYSANLYNNNNSYIDSKPHSNTYSQGNKN